MKNSNYTCFGVPTISVGARLTPLAPLTPNGSSRGKGARENKGYVILCFVVPTTSVGARLTPSLLPSLPMDQVEVGGNGEQGVCCTVLGFPPPLLGQGSLPLLTAHFPCSLSIPGSLGPWEALSLLPLLPARFPCPLDIPRPLGPPWGLKKPSACTPYSQLAPLASWTSLVPLTSLGHWDLPGDSGSPQLTPLALTCSPYSLSIPGSLGPPWDLRKPPACSPCSQLAPLAL